MRNKQPFFIVGTGRSGSTYLYHILKKHSKIALTNEAKLLDALFFCYEYCTLPNGEVSERRGFCGVVHADAIPVFSNLFAKHAKQMLEEFYTASFNKPFTHWGDKLPDPYCAVAARRIFPQVHFIVLVRDPRDVLCSYRSFSLGLSTPFNRWWVGLSYREQCDAWRKIYDYILSNLDVYHVVAYEQLVYNPVKVVKGVFRFLGLDMCPAVEHAIQTNNSFAGHSISPSPQASIGRWKRELTPEEVRMVEDVCGPLMRRFGYMVNH